MSKIDDVLGDCFEAEPAGYFDFDRARQALYKDLRELIGTDSEARYMSMGNELYSGAVDADSFRKGYRMKQDFMKIALAEYMGVKNG